MKLKILMEIIVCIKNNNKYIYLFIHKILYLNINLLIINLLKYFKSK